MTLFLVIAAAVGSAFGAGGEVFGEGVLRADLNAHARRVMNRILTEIEETQSDSPDFAVGSDWITYNRVVSLTAAGPVYGPERRIGFDSSKDQINMAIQSQSVSEELTGDANSLTFTPSGSRLTVAVSIKRKNVSGQTITQTVTGDVNVHR